MYFVLKLSGHLIYLGRLHVLMVHVISLDLLVDSVQLVVLVHVIQELVALSKFVDHKLLKLHNINNIEESFHLIKEHNA